MHAHTLHSSLNYMLIVANTVVIHLTQLSFRAFALSACCIMLYDTISV